MAQKKQVKKTMKKTEPVRKSNETINTSNIIVDSTVSSALNAIEEEDTIESLIEKLEDAMNACHNISTERRLKNESSVRVDNVGRMLNEHIKALKPLCLQ